MKRMICELAETCEHKADMVHCVEHDENCNCVYGPCMNTDRQTQCVPVKPKETPKHPSPNRTVDLYKQVRRETGKLERIKVDEGFLLGFGTFGDMQNGIETLAIVELEDGNIETYSLQMVTFTKKEIAANVASEIEKFRRQLRG